MTERWIRVHPVCLAWVPLAAGFWHAAALGAAGFLLWTLAEYILHRWLFHYEPKTSFGQRLHWLIHGYHHALRRLPLGRRLKGYHLRHHLRDDASGFGVTSRLWDRVFGTLTR